jgi:hypothetical protein
VIGASVTLRTSASRGVFACDGAARRARDARWCGRAYGRLVGRKLEDPRLDLAGCVTAADEPIAFAWFEPGRGTAHVAVRQSGYVEVYSAAAGLPIRIATTSGIDLDTSRAAFHVSEFDGRGALIRSSTLDARVAG